MPAVARKGDSGVVHCSGFTIAAGSPDVFINGKPAARVGDSNTTHKRPGKRCPAHSTAISSGSSSVFVNGKALARVGDPFSSCTQIAQGSSDVFCG